MAVGGCGLAVGGVAMAGRSTGVHPNNGRNSAIRLLYHAFHANNWKNSSYFALEMSM
ncbi:hypothetical protein [Paenibacillus planticolens]|uniref:hypothetical protein n=1 Tax=Paenibacillus planticolens TaxID=2654976 RepID=UPI0014918399|nr:hypothetical protein [Paenibacillus planticolens]